MKKIILALSLLFCLSATVPVFSGEYVDYGYISDDSFTMNFWVDLPEVSSSASTTYNYLKVINVSSDVQVLIDVYVPYEGYTGDYEYSFSFVNSTTGALVAFAGFLDPGSHMVTLNFDANNLFYTWLAGRSRGYYYPAQFYIDGSLGSFYYANGSFSAIQGNILVSSDNVIPGTFYYSPDLLTSDQIRQAYDFGTPGTINYQVNLLFWEVIKHFQDFF